MSALAAGAGLAAVVLAAEMWLRSAAPFVAWAHPREFAPGVGLIGSPGAVIRVTNHLDFWQIQQVNRQGFLDREPPDQPALLATRCRVAVIGDSFVEAKQVPIEAKMHIRLEALAAAAWRLRAFAFGRGATGQVNQLALYDAFARHLHPKLVVLVFHGNDYADNSPYLTAARAFRDPDRLPYAVAVRSRGGALRLRAPRYPEDFALQRQRWNAAPSTAPGIRQVALVLTTKLPQRSYFGAWLNAKTKHLLQESGRPNEAAWARELQRRPQAAALMAAWQSSSGSPQDPFQSSVDEPLPAAYAAELELTAFGLEQFRARAARDGASLVVLATHHLRPGTPPFDRMRAMADELGIPVVSQHEYIVAQGRRPEDANWPHDGHWNPAGHEWAAQALWDWLRRRPDICAPVQDGGG